MNIRDTIVRKFTLNELHDNHGQVPNLPANPRFIRNEKYTSLLNSLREGDLTGVLPMKVYQHDGQWVVLGGNMRLRAMQELGIADVSCIVIPQDTDAQTLRKIVLLDNASFGEWDWDLLANDWDMDELDAAAIDTPIDWNLDNNDMSEEDGGVCDKNETAERLLNEAMKQYCGEFADMVDYCMGKHFLPSGMSRGYAKMKFIKAKYYGKRYERKNAIIFCPEMFFVSSHKYSYYEQLRRVSNETDAGIAGFRTQTGDGNLQQILSSSYPNGGSRGVLDFPVEIMRIMIQKYMPNKGRVLDPCHGWGGRLIGALLEEVQEYVGFDPSPVAHRGVMDIADTFGEYQDTKVNLHEMCYEMSNPEGLFDFALTSPPYFDVEDYQGDKSSHRMYNNYSLWVQKFYKPLIEKTMSKLKGGCSFILQVGSQRYPLREDAIKIAKNAGYKIEIVAENAVSSNNKLHNTEEERGETLIRIYS